mgnify:CR=1 FL=1
MAAKKGKEIRERHASDRIFNAAVIILSITTFIVIAYPPVSYTHLTLPTKA